MKKSRYSEQQIRAILARPDEGTPITQICREAEISEATFYNWRKRYGQNSQTARRDIGRSAPQPSKPTDHARLAQLEEENRRLKRMVIDMLLEKAKLQEQIAKRG